MLEISKGKFKNIINLILASSRGVLGMVVSNLFVSFLQIITKPWFLIPIIALLLIGGATSGLSLWALERPFTDFVLYYNTVPNDNLLGIMLANYPLELATYAVLGLVLSVIGMIAMISIARLAKGEKFVDAINDTAKEWKRAFAAALIFWLVFFIFAAIFSAIGEILQINELIGSILLVIFLIILFVIITKIIFTLPALTEKDLKKAVQESWKFSNKRFWGTIALVFLTMLISFFVIYLLTNLGATLGDTFEFPLALIAEAFGSTYFVVSITNYFYEKNK